MSELVRLLDWDAAAQFLNTTPRHVRKLVETRQLAHVKVGKLVRIEPSAIAEYIERQRRPAIERGASRAGAGHAA
jgi:excisionase family DNA binding protein